MQLKTESVAHYHVKKGDLIVLVDLIYRVVESSGDFTNPRFRLDPMWSFKTKREASGVIRDYAPEGNVTKVVLAY